jgi:predicted nucleotidyltransferase component of viral defense system
MLKYETVYPGTLELLRKLMAFPVLEKFYLVGGTALSMHLGHRISVDLDLFTNAEFDTQELVQQLENEISIEKVIGEAKNTLNLVIDNVEVDILRHNYPLIEPVLIIDDIRLLSDKDIAAMKLSAIARRGSKKDFYDVYFLLQKYSIDDIFGFYQQKYHNKELFHIVKSLVYFGEADTEPQPKLLFDIEWNEVRGFIRSLMLKY